jgi:uncharacterized protein YkwD
VRYVKHQSFWRFRQRGRAVHDVCRAEARLGTETAFTKASDAIYPAHVRPRLPLALAVASLAAFAALFALRAAIVDDGARRAPSGSVDPLGAVWIMGVPQSASPSLTLPQALDLIGAVQKIAAFAAPPRTEPAPAAPPVAQAQPPASTAPQPAPAAWLDRDFASGVLAGVNAQRRAAGLAPLAFDGTLARAAQGYAQTMAHYNWFSHTGPDGSSFADRIRAAGFTANVGMGEVIASGDSSFSAGDFVQMWMGSGGVAVRCVMDVAG